LLVESTVVVVELKIETSRWKSRILLSLTVEISLIAA